MASHSLSALPMLPSHSSSCCRKPYDLSSPLQLAPKSTSNLVTSLLGLKLSIHPFHSRHLAVKSSQSTASTVLLSLPTANQERTATQGNHPKWSARAIKSFAMAELEARKLKYPNTGTEALLMGILVEGTSQAAQFLRANEITLLKVREETINLLGRSDLYFFSPEHPPLTEPAQRALDWAVDEKLKSGGAGEITPTHILLGLWLETESAGHKILAGLGFDDEKVKELSKTVSFMSGFVITDPNVITHIYPVLSS